MKRDLNTLAHQEYDVVVVGAGIYGAVVAWEAASRGLSVALIDKGDFGGGTSSNSLKIVHGGFRYLQYFNVKRMRKSILERRIFMRIVPHLVKTLPCVMPTYGHLMKGKEVMRLGMLMNDLISFDRNRLGDPEKTIPAGRVISKDECLSLVPGIDGRRVTGGVLWYDAQMINSERLLLSFVLSANKCGAQIANYIDLTGFLTNKGRIKGIKVRDVLTGDGFEIRAKVVFNTSGGWVDKVVSLINGYSNRINLSTAMNLVVNRQMLPECAAGILSRFDFTRADNTVYQGSRVLFMAPWRHYTLIGTYHSPYSGDPDALRVTEDEIQTFLDEINNAYPGAPILREEISFFHKGFLPMDGINKSTGEVKLTKHYILYDHSREDGLEGLISVVGVKYTTARYVAQKAVDMVFRKLGKKPAKSMSDKITLIGGDIDRFGDFMAEAISRSQHRLTEEVIRHLVYNYGSEYRRILQYIDEHSILGKTVPGSHEVLTAEIVHSIREEMALKLKDVVFRRTDLGSGSNPGDAALNTCAKMMAKELGWDKTRMKQEIVEVQEAYIPER